MRESDVHYCLWLGGDGAYKGSNGGNISRGICLENALERGCVVDVKEDKFLVQLLHTHTMKTAGQSRQGRDVHRRTGYLPEYFRKGCCHRRQRLIEPGLQSVGPPGQGKLFVKVSTSQYALTTTTYGR